ncbi:MAG: hypothetical protein EXX96DRAFT_644166 [Benjaminiella poitrasii]|nr:MAG: hypothetical protein EXX96DRAFT_644166 [Benjaminiella poitrasii]
MSYNTNTPSIPSTIDKSPTNPTLFISLTVATINYPLQETHTDSTDLEQLFHTHFYTSQSAWTHHCCLASLSLIYPFLTLTRVPAAVSFWLPSVTPKSICDSNTTPLLIPVQPRRYIILGDLNYSYPSHLSSSVNRALAPSCWLNHLIQYYTDALTRELIFALSAQVKWEALKEVARFIARSYSRKKAYNLQRAERLLSRKRRSIFHKLRSNPTSHQDVNPQL